MFDKNKYMEKLRNMNPDDVAIMVKKTWEESINSWTECKNCIHSRDCGWTSVRNGCYLAKSIEEH